MKSSGGPLLVNVLDTGANHAWALEFSGTAWCWGDENSGQVADQSG